MRRAFKISACILLLVIIALSVIARTRYESNLARTRYLEYAVEARSLFRYFAVPVGSTEEDIAARFGSPARVFEADGAEIEEYVDRRHDHGWSEPPYRKAHRVMLYEATEGTYLMEIYYLLDGRGRLIEIFASED